MTKKQKAIARQLRKNDIHKLAKRLDVDFKSLVKEISK